MVPKTRERLRRLKSAASNRIPPNQNSNLKFDPRAFVRNFTIWSILVLTTGVAPAAAQLGEASESLCGTGVDAIIALVLSLIILYGVAKGLGEGALGMVDYDNPDPQTSQEGKTRIRSGVVSMFGPAAFVIAALVGLEIVGFGVAGCFMPDLGLFGLIAPGV